MKTATVNFKTDNATKVKAQAVAKQLGIPLSNLLNAYMYELAATGSVHFSTVENMTPQMEVIITGIEKEIENNELSGPFNSKEEVIGHLDSLT